MTKPPKTMLDVIRYGEESGDSSLVQYAGNLTKIAGFRGLDVQDLSTMPADVETYLGFTPKFDKRTTWLVEAIVRRKWSEKTYKQYQRTGRLIIEHCIGAFAEKK